MKIWIEKKAKEQTISIKEVIFNEKTLSFILKDKVLLGN